MFFRCSLVRIWFVWRHHHHLRRRWRLQWRRRLENSNDFNLYTLHVNVSARASCNISNFISRFEGNLSSVWRQKSAVFRLVLHFCSIVVQCDNDFDAVSTFNNIVVARLAVLNFFLHRLRFSDSKQRKTCTSDHLLARPLCAVLPKICNEVKINLHQNRIYRLDCPSINVFISVSYSGNEMMQFEIVLLLWLPKLQQKLPEIHAQRIFLQSFFWSSVSFAD